MITSRKVLSFALLVGAWGLALSPAAHAAKFTPAKQAAARQRFLSLLLQRETTGNPADIPLDPRIVRKFDRQIKEYTNKHGNTLPPLFRVGPDGNLPSPVSKREVYRQNFVLELLRQRALRRPGGGAARLNTALGVGSPGHF